MPLYTPPVRRDEGSTVLVWGPVIAWLVMWAALLDWHVDDAGISYAYARNAALGHGFSPYAGAPPVEGFSNPAWTTILAALAIVGMPPHVAAKLLQAGLGAATLFGVHRLVLRVGGERAEAAGTAAVTAICAPFVVWTAGGLETALLSAAMVGFLYAALVESTGVSAGLCAGLVVLARPEGPVLLAALFLAAELLVPHDRWRERRVPALLIAAGFLVAWQGYRLAVFDAWMPNAWWSELRAGLPRRLLGGAVYAATFAAEIAAPLLAIGLMTAWRIRRLNPLVKACAVVVTAGVAVVLFTGGDWMRHGRVLAPFVPLIAAATVPGLMALFLRPMDVGRTLLTGAARWLVWLYVGGFVAIEVLFWQDALRRPPMPMTVVTRTARAFAAVGPPMCGERELVVATPDVGGMLYADPRHVVIDLGLITDPQAAVAGGQDYWVERLQRERPQLVLVHGVWVPRTGLDDGAMTEAGYVLVCRRTGTPGPAEERFPPSVYRRADCTRPVGFEAAAGLDVWCSLPR